MLSRCIAIQRAQLVDRILSAFTNSRSAVAESLLLAMCGGMAIGADPAPMLSHHAPEDADGTLLFAYEYQAVFRTSPTITPKISSEPSGRMMG